MYKKPFAGRQTVFKLRLILKFQLVNAHSIAVLNTQCFEALEHAGAAQDTVDVHAALIITEVDGHEKALKPGTLYRPVIVVMVYCQFFACAGFWHGRNVVGLVAYHGREF